MILSFHPCIKADKNILVKKSSYLKKGQLRLLKAADAVILPQGCPEWLYQLTTNIGMLTFPNYKTRFSFKGKIGQILLFRKYGIPHPKTILYKSVSHFKEYIDKNLTIDYPFVIKANYGGEGRSVWLVNNHKEMEKILYLIESMEKAGFYGIVFQEYIPHGGKDLRIIVMYKDIYSFWRVQKKDTSFKTNLAQGGVITNKIDHGLEERGKEIVMGLIDKAKIDLGAFDIIFNLRNHDKLFGYLIEINYYFGRRFFGSSDKYYLLLARAINKWLFDKGIDGHVEAYI